MDKKLFGEALAKFLLGVVLLGALIFWPAGTLCYPQGLLLMGALFLPMFGAGLVMMKHSPDLLKSRLKAKEKESDQQWVIKLSGLLFLCVFILCGLQYRHQFHVLPIWVSLVFVLVFLMGYLLYALVLRENAFLSRTIEVQENQHVVDTGLYAYVRHPMYTATFVLFFSIPLILGSLIGFFIMLLYVPIIVLRIRNEEKVLTEQLQGYKEYCQKVRWRLIPGIW